MARTTIRTPEETAAFKAANIAAAAASRRTIIVEPRKGPSKRWTITWMTAAGKFGWTTIRCQSMDQAVERFCSMRGDRKIPAEAEIEMIKPGGQGI